MLRLESLLDLNIDKADQEWDKDRWDIRALYATYGINYNKSQSQHFVDFSKIRNDFTQFDEAVSYLGSLTKNHMQDWDIFELYLRNRLEFKTLDFRGK